MKKKKFYKTNWFLWLCLICFPPIGIILLWTCHKRKKNILKIILSVVFLFWFIILIAATHGGSTTSDTDTKQTEDVETETSTVDTEETENKQTSLYDNAEIKDVMNGYHTEKIGEYSIIKVSSDEVTEEALADWYFDYVEENDFNWCMILYTDKDNNSGVYAISGMVEVDVTFDEDEYGDYSLGKSGTLYIPSDDGTLTIME